MVQYNAQYITHIVCGIVEFFPIGRLLSPSDLQLRMRPFDVDYFLIGLFLSSTIVTGVCTCLIAHRILSTTRNSPSLTSLTSYRTVQRIVIESGVIYSIGMLTTGIAITVGKATASRTNTNDYMQLVYKNCNIVQTYGQALLTPIAVGLSSSICNRFQPTADVRQGIAPTLIAMRVVTRSAEAEEDESKLLSDLAFQRSTTQSNTHSVGTIHYTIRSVSSDKSLKQLIPLYHG